MKTQYKLIQTITVAALLLIFAGCSQEVLKAPSTGSGTALSSGTESYIVSGAVSFDSAALPKAFFSQESSSSRTATSTFSLEDGSCVVKAIQNEQIITGTVTKNVNLFNYSVELPSKGIWVIEVYFYMDNILVVEDTAEITITTTDSNGSIKTLPFTLNYAPEIDTTGKGSINLKIKNSSSNVSSITWDWIDEAKDGDTIIDGMTKTVSGVGQSVSFSFNSINSKNYRVKISFKDSSDKILYSCFENIIVFPRSVTDTWYGPSPYINSSNEFVYNDSLSATYAQGINHVDIPTGEQLYLLWSDFEYEPDSIAYNLPEQNELGGQIFASITEGMTITKPIVVDCGSNFCYDNNIIYAPPYRYTNSYAGFGKDPGFDLDSVIIDSFNETPKYHSSMILGNYLYFMFSFELYGESSFFLGRYGIQDKSVAFTDLPINYLSDGSVCSAFTVVQPSGSDSGILYYTLEGDITVLWRKPFQIRLDNSGNDIIKLDEGADCDASSLDINSLSDDQDEKRYYFYGELSVSDMRFVDNKLYVLVYISKNINYYTLQDNAEPNDSSSYNLSNLKYICNGGILKFDQSSLSAELPFPENWTTPSDSSINKKIIGMHPIEGNTTYYTYKSDKDQLPSVVHGLLNENDYYFAPIQPELEDDDTPSTQYLYGPRKFLSASTTELVFVDDGGYIENLDDPYDPKTMPVNRIATLNLTNETFSFVNVNATFSAALSPITASFKPDPYSGGMIIPGPGPKP